MALVKLVYVAGPYRGPNAWAVECNIRRAEELGFRVAELGAQPLIPHTNNRFFNGTLDDRFWLLGAMEMMRRSDAVIFVRNWKRSSGSRDEHEEALRLGLPIFYHPRELAKWLSPVERFVTETQLCLELLQVAHAG